MWRKNNTDTIDSIKRDIRRIRRSGAHAEILGWLLLLCAAAIIWLSGTRSSALIRFGIFIAVGIFFIYTGKYIKDGRGRRVQYALLANGIVAFPLCVGILPIYVCIQSVNNYSRFKDLPDNIRDLYNKPKPLRVDIRDVLFLATFLLLGVGSLGLKFKHLHVTSHVASSVQSKTPPVNTLSKYHFTISFPDTASATDLTEQVLGHDVTYTTYNSTAQNGTEDFDVYAYSYPAQYFNYGGMAQPAMIKTVHNVLMTTIQGLQGTLVSSAPSTYVGYTSEDAQFTCQTLGGTKTGYLRVFFIGNYEYSIFAKGSSQSEFDTFANSFQYKGV